MFLKSPARAAVALLLAFIAPAASAHAQNDPVLEGYTRVYAGDADSAHAHFARLRQRDAQGLAAWFGQLFALRERTQFDDSLGNGFEREIAAFIAHAEQRQERSRADAEALFYLAQAHLLRSIYRIDNDKGVWGAARDAAKSKDYADQYLRHHPEHGDAYLALGLYNYYVDIAPNFVKVLRVLLFLPGGNRVEGLKQLERVARTGSLFAPLADVALAQIYGALEGRVAEAIPIAERLVRQFPANAGMRLDLAQLYAHPAVEAFDRAAQQYNTVIAAAASGSRRHLGERHSAIRGLAGLRRNQWRLEEAIALLTPPIDQKVTTPSWVLPSFLLRRGNYRMLLNDPRAEEDARRVAADASMDKFHKAAAQQLDAIAARRRTNEGAIYAALVPGNRYVVEDRWDEARAVYEKVGATAPGDWQVRYRLAYLDFARGHYDAAAAALAPIASALSGVPAWLKAAALLNLAWTHDIAGRRAEALKLYKRIVDDYEDESSAGSARLGLIAPYRGRIHQAPTATGQLKQLASPTANPKLEGAPNLRLQIAVAAR